MPGPLDGIRVIDLTTMIAGPFATMMLADQGAEVIKIEGPARGDQVREAGTQNNGLSASFVNNNRNKRSVTIDLKSPRGAAVLKRLSANADVFVQNFRPGVVDRLGLGEPEIRAVAPAIIYVSMSGFGDRGPYAHKPAYDPIIQAVAGLASIQGGGDESRPRLIRTIVPDKVTALTAAQAITAALLARARGGMGVHVKLSMLDAVLAFLWASDMGAQTFVDVEVPQQRAASFIDLIYETRDGFMSVAIMTDAQWSALATALEHPEWREDPRFATMALRDRNIDERLAMTQEVLRARTTAEWLQRLEAAGVPCGPVLTRNQLIDHPQVAASASLIEYSHPHAGRLRQARPAARFDAVATEIRPAPLLGADTDAVLAQSGFSRQEIAALRADGTVGGGA
jgi:crotonobetainyl-CoA:carnitine CoA-transferase CaiB-like acyl-CoA transferase